MDGYQPQVKGNNKPVNPPTGGSNVRLPKNLTDKLENVNILKIKDGDTLVLMLKDKLSNIDYKIMQRSWQGWFDGHGFKDLKIIIIEGGAELGVIRKG